MAAGGEVDIHGDTVYIVQLPKKNSSNQSSGSIEAKAPVSEKTSEPVEEPKAEETVEKTSEPVEESKVEAAPEPKSEEPKVEAASEPKPAAKPGPKPKTSENKAGE
jgi:outer membrane biosynthesis protein TonB